MWRYASVYQVPSFISSKWWGKRVAPIIGVHQGNMGGADTVVMKKQSPCCLTTRPVRLKAYQWTHFCAAPVRKLKDIKEVLSEENKFKTRDHESHLRQGLKQFLYSFSSSGAESEDNIGHSERTDQRLGKQSLLANKKFCLLDLFRYNLLSKCINTVH